MSYRGKPDNRFYLVLWKPQANGLPWPKDNTTWEPARHLVGCDELVSQFWDSYQARHLNVNEDFPGCENENRCHWCCKFFKRPQDLKGHLTKGCDQKPKRQHNTKSKSGKAVKRMKQAEAQKHMEQVLIGETRLENVYDFPYLGHHFQADGDALHAVEVRLAMASNRFGQLHHIWSSNILSMGIKTQLYRAAVCSILTHAHEAWKLTAATVRKLKGWNGRHLAVITSDKLEDPEDPESFRELIKLQTLNPDYDLVAELRVRRLRWVGHILRKDERSLVRQVLLKFNAIYPEGYPKGSLLMDAPRHETVSDLIALAGTHEEHTGWNLIQWMTSTKIRGQNGSL